MHTPRAMIRGGGEEMPILVIGGTGFIGSRVTRRLAIRFEHQEGGKARSGMYLVDNSRLLDEFKIEYRPFRQRVLQIINAIRRQGGLPSITR
jgi:nucleoside-diphosphate-sugar epimerase